MRFTLFILCSLASSLCSLLFSASNLPVKDSKILQVLVLVFEIFGLSLSLYSLHTSSSSIKFLPIEEVVVIHFFILKKNSLGFAGSLFLSLFKFLGGKNGGLLGVFASIKRHLEFLTLYLTFHLHL
jgi:hypothetical protein